MYFLQLDSASGALPFLRFTAEFYSRLFRGEQSNEPAARLVEGLKEQLSPDTAEGVVRLHFDFEVLQLLAVLIDALAKMNLEKEEYFAEIASGIEEETGLKIWRGYLIYADQFFRDLRGFVSEEDWARLQQGINSVTPGP